MSGGDNNSASGLRATVCGGLFDSASGDYAAVGGGFRNFARGNFAAVGGGGGYPYSDSNSAMGVASVIPSGRRNLAAGDFPFAAGLRGQANHDGCFVWADSTDADFASTAEDQFLIRATGGVGINKTDPNAPLDIKSVPGSGNEVLRFTMDRNWAFRQHSSGPGTGLEIASLTPGNLKDFLITTEGNVGISTTNPTEKLHVVGNICYTGSIAACSDGRYKTDVTDIPNSLDKVMQMRGVRYNWKQDEYPEHDFDDREHLGFIAQEVETLFPEMVLTDDEGYKSVDYGRLTPVLVEAIKDQQRQINELRLLIEQQAASR